MEHLAKKTMELDEEAIKKLRRLFDTKTDKEAVNSALRLVADEEEIIQIHESLAGTVELDHLFE